jgi:hypothetical protein
VPFEKIDFNDRVEQIARDWASIHLERHVAEQVVVGETIEEMERVDRPGVVRRQRVAHGVHVGPAQLPEVGMIAAKPTQRVARDEVFGPDERRGGVFVETGITPFEILKRRIVVSEVRISAGRQLCRGERRHSRVRLLPVVQGVAIDNLVAVRLDD